MKDGINYDVESGNLHDLKESGKKVSDEVRNILHNAVISELIVNTEDDFKALGRIKLEDLEVQETVLEFESEFNKFIAQQSGNYNYVQGTENEYDSDLFSTIEINENFEIQESLLEKILSFFKELYEDNEEVVGLEYDLNPFNRKKRKKKFLLESIIAFLKKLLSNGQSLNLKQLLDQQILELQDQLSEELDPELRKLLQERLMLLSELRTQLMSIGINSKLLFNFFTLSSLVSAASVLQQDTSVASKNATLQETVGVFMHRRDVYNAEQNSPVSQVSDASNPVNVLFVQAYVPGILYGKVNELRYKAHDQYFFVHRDVSFHQMHNIGLQHGILLAIIMRVINTVLSKVKGIFKGAISMLDAAPYREYTKCNAYISDVKPLKTTSYSYMQDVNFGKNVIFDVQQMMGRLSLLSYRSEISFAYPSEGCSTYIEEIRVTQMEVCKSNVVNMGRVQ